MGILSLIFSHSKATIEAENAAYERKKLMSEDKVLLHGALCKAADYVDTTLLSSQEASGNVCFFRWFVTSSRYPEFKVLIEFFHRSERSVFIIVRDPAAVARVSSAIREIDPARLYDPASWASVGTVVDEEAFHAGVYNKREAVIIKIRGYTVPLTVEQKEHL